MLSVLIQNKNTIESFNEHYPLFLEQLESNQVAVCRWYETGTTIDTAVPELIDVTEKVESWRAIIVQTEAELEHPASNINPYDFEENAEYKQEVEESKIPLIRLTQLLGGVPAPEVQFETVKNPIPDSANSIIYVPIRDEEQDRAYEELSQKYSFDGKRPKEILIVTLRKKNISTEKETRSYWNNKREIQSSEFWKRNKYPSICRFIVFDVDDSGQNEREAKMFNFWTSILLLASNEMNPNHIQAYRLYSIKSSFDKQEMQRTFQSKINELAGARHYLEQEIKLDIERQTIEKKTVPYYSVEVPVAFELPKTKDIVVSDKDFAITAQTSNDDFNKWERATRHSVDAVNTAIVGAERALDEAAERMRHNYKMKDDGVTKLDKYQKMDMCNELDKLYFDIIDTQCALHSSTEKIEKKLKEPDERVRKHIPLRVTSSKTTSIFSGLIFGVVLAMIASGYFYSIKNYGSIFAIVGFTATIVGALVLSVVITLVIQKGYFKNKISAYNLALSDAVGEIVSRSDKFSRFISNVASYTRGRSYLEILNRKQFALDHKYFKHEEHIKEINTFLNKIKLWSQAFYLDTDFEFDCYESVPVEYSLSSKTYYRYTFEYNEAYDVIINRSGEYIDSPFSFVTKLNIQREELYDE